ncbi:hypothetical protein [Robinsoniella peoriensis]|uniref:hypothetical protein n=1 Tax=Robinsoniella peoriensis TaxID=180332 RepID=UPI003625794D
MTTATQTQFISPLLLMAVANFRKRNPQNGLKSGGLEPFVQNGACIKDGTALDPGAVTGYSFFDAAECVSVQCEMCGKNCSEKISCFMQLYVLCQ